MAADTRQPIEAGPVDAAWIESTPALEDLVSDIGADDYAIDTEFHRENTYFPRLGLVQIAWSDGVALVDPLAVDIAPLARLFSSGGAAVAHAADQDIDVLRRACDALPARLFDTQVAARFLGLGTPSLSSALERFVGVRVPKAHRLADWTKRPLTDDQRSYAANDVIYLLELADRLRTELQALGRLEWAEDECRLMLERPGRDVEPPRAWWKLKGSRQLRGRERGVAQAVCEWREERAARLDVPLRRVLPDLAVTSITHTPPSSASEVRALRGVEGRPLGEEAMRELLAAIERGRNLTPDELQLPPYDDDESALDPRWRPAAGLVSAWVAQRARELRIDPTLLATRADIEGFLAGRRNGRVMSGWRRGLVGDPLLRLLEGDAAVAFGANGSLVLEQRSNDPLDVSGDQA